MDKVYSDIGNFEQRLKMTGLRPTEDSDSDRPERSDLELLDEKNRILLERLHKEEKKRKELQEIIDTF